MRLLSLVLAAGLVTSLFGQTRLAVYDVERPKMSSSAFDNVSSQIVSMYANDDRFIIIDKANSQMIADEQDRQKSEEFMDGYIVDQGKQEGFDYCYYPKYTDADRNLTIRLYDVAKGTVVASEVVKVKSSILGTPRGLQEFVVQSIERINNRIFAIRTEILRVTDSKKGKARMALIATGYNQNAKTQNTYQIYQLVEEKIGQRTVEREDVIGKGVIDKVIDGNFSDLKIKDGHVEIYNALEGGALLYARIAD